jgi:hypothetical protein
MAAFNAESAHERKKGLGNPRNLLKRLDSDKENKGNSFDFFDRAWLDLAGFGSGLAEFGFSCAPNYVPPASASTRMMRSPIST